MWFVMQIAKVMLYMFIRAQSWQAEPQTGSWIPDMRIYAWTSKYIVGSLMEHLQNLHLYILIMLFYSIHM